MVPPQPDCEVSAANCSSIYIKNKLTQAQNFTQLKNPHSAKKQADLLPRGKQISLPEKWDIPSWDANISSMRLGSEIFCKVWQDFVITVKQLERHFNQASSWRSILYMRKLKFNTARPHKIWVTKVTRCYRFSAFWFFFTIWIRNCVME